MVNWRCLAYTWIQRAYAPFRAFLPKQIADPLRSVATAFLAPVLFSLRSGHFRSSFARAAVDRQGEPIPWYTYPCIEFLNHRDFSNASVLEFGGGQSTIWWGRRAKRVLCLEDNAEWLGGLRQRVSPAVELRQASMASPQACVDSINEAVQDQRFDVVVIDGLWRDHLISIAARVVSDTGIIICDNSEGYGFQQRFSGYDFMRVDFYGYVPGLVQPHCTSIYFKPGAAALHPGHKIAVVA